MTEKPKVDNERKKGFLAGCKYVNALNSIKIFEAGIHDQLSYISNLPPQVDIINLNTSVQQSQRYLSLIKRVYNICRRIQFAYYKDNTKKLKEHQDFLERKIDKFNSLHKDLSEIIAYEEIKSEQKKRT